MEAEGKQRESQIKNENLSRSKRRAVNQLAVGSLILLWGSLLALKQVGIVPQNVSTWPFPLAVFGMLLVASGIYRLSRESRL